MHPSVVSCHVSQTLFGSNAYKLSDNKVITLSAMARFTFSGELGFLSSNQSENTSWGVLDWRKDVAVFSPGHQDLTETCPDMGRKLPCSSVAVVSVPGSSGLSKGVLSFRN